MNPEPTPLFELIIDTQIQRRLRKIPDKHRKQILKRISALRNDPRPQDSKNLQSEKYEFRLDVGEYRLLYDINYKIKIVTIYRLLQRGEGYRRYLR